MGSDENLRTFGLIAGAIIVGALLIAVSIYMSGENIAEAISSIKFTTVISQNATLQDSGDGRRAQQRAEVRLPREWQELKDRDSCSGEKPKIILFTDPYCPACVAAEPIINAFVRKYKNHVDISHKVALTYSSGLIQPYGKYNASQILAASKYFVCAAEQGKLLEFKNEFYKNLKDDGRSYIPFTEAELFEFGKTAGLEREKLNSCLLEAEERLQADMDEALDYGGGTYFTPMAVIDCRYVGNYVAAEQVLCTVFPGTPGCRST